MPVVDGCSPFLLALLKAGLFDDCGRLDGGKPLVSLCGLRDCCCCCNWLGAGAGVVAPSSEPLLITCAHEVLPSAATNHKQNDSFHLILDILTFNFVFFCLNIRLNTSHLHAVQINKVDILDDLSMCLVRLLTTGATFEVTSATGAVVGSSGA